MEVLPKDIIRTWLVPYLPTPTRGRRRAADQADLLAAMLYKLKTGCQWRYLPVKQFFPGKMLSWQGVYYHFRAWCQDGTWKNIWLTILRVNKRLLDLSSVQLDGSHTPAKNGGAAVGYQGRKKARTTNTLFLADNHGQLLACATPQAGNHHDVFELPALFAELCAVLEAADIALAGLFLNADSGFDTRELRQACAARDIEANIARNPRSRNWHTEDDTFFDEELYRCRTVIEHANAWLDSFKTLLVRYETGVPQWLAFHWLAFIVLFLRKLPRPTNF